METNQGLTLDRYLKEKGALAPDQAAKIAIQVAQQMGPAAGPLLIHPGRILVTREGSVRLLPPPAEELALPAIVEFPAYASPEEIHGGDPDIRSGLYSLGSTLFELISGHPPYQRKDPKELLRAHLEDPVPDLKELSPSMKPALAEVVRELLEKDPELRIQSAGELVRRLKQALHGGGAATNYRTNSSSPSGATRKENPAAAASAPRKTAPQSPRPSPPSQAPPSSSPQPVPPPLLERRPAVGARARSQGHLTSGSLQRGSHAHGHGHGSSHSHGHGHSHSPTARQGRDPTGSTSPEEMEEAEGWEESQRKRSIPYFSIAGAVLGAFFGLLVIRSAMQRAEDRIHADAQEKEQKIADAIAARKKKFLDGLEDTRKNAEQSFSKAMKVPEEKQREQLILCISNYLDSPSIKPMAEALLKTPAFVAEAPKPEDVAKREAAYQKQKEEALKLYGEGRIGDALSKMYEDFQDYKERHDAEITQFIDKCSAELNSRWKATLELVERLRKDAEGEKAIEELRKAMVYGDKPIRDKSQETIDQIQQLLAIRAKGDSVKLPQDQLKDDKPKGAEEADPKKGESSGAGSGKEKKPEKKKAGE